MINRVIIAFTIAGIAVVLLLAFLIDAYYGQGQIG